MGVLSRVEGAFLLGGNGDTYSCVAAVQSTTAHLKAGRLRMAQCAAAQYGAAPRVVALCVADPQVAAMTSEERGGNEGGR